MIGNISRNFCLYVMQYWKNFSFVIPGKLAGMSHPGYSTNLDDINNVGLCKSLEILKQQGISAIVSLCEDTLALEPLQKFQFDYLHLPIIDMHVPKLEQADQFVAFVNLMFQQNRGVVVHCFAGQGRTGTILACYLVSDGYRAAEAVSRIRDLRPGSIETEIQEEFVFIYEAHCNAKKKLK